jgi:hypothetical protein
MESLYIALIGDIIKSRSINNRNEIQLKLEDIFTRVNAKYEQFIVSKFLITIGDEFQGLLKPSAPIYEIIYTIVEPLYPIQVRFGLGLGVITTPLKEMALGMDGPAFYLARESLKVAHEKKGHAIVFKSDILDKVAEDAINMMFGSLAVIRKLWPESFWEILPYLRMGKTQNEIASLIKVTQPYISKLIKSACWKEVETLEEQLAHLLKTYLG